MFVYQRTGLDGLVAVVDDVWDIVAVVKLDDHPMLQVVTRGWGRLERVVEHCWRATF